MPYQTSWFSSFCCLKSWRESKNSNLHICYNTHTQTLNSLGTYITRIESIIIGLEFRPLTLTSVEILLKLIYYWNIRYNIKYILI